MAHKRHIVEGKQSMGTDENIAYRVDVSRWGVSPISPEARIYTRSPWVDVTGAKMSGAATANGNIITLPAISGLENGKAYQVQVKFTIDGNVLECYFNLDCED